MAIELKTGQTARITITKTINRASARKTLERIFLLDDAHVGPLDARSANFIPLPKRRGGCIWTKRPNKVFPKIIKGAAATIKATPSILRDLTIVAAFVEIAAA